VPGGRYDTLFSNCIRTFGWEMFLASVPHHEEEFDRVLEGFTEISIAESEAWARTGLEVFITHDDIAWTEGLVFSPAWYRRHVIPRYSRIWEPLKRNGSPVIFLSDGFMFEPVVPLDLMVAKFGRTKVLVCNGDCRILQFGAKEDVSREVRRCVDLGRDCPGYFMALGNHIPNTISTPSSGCAGAVRGGSGGSPPLSARGRWGGPGSTPRAPPPRAMARSRGPG